LAAEPIARTGKPKFKFSLAAYSYRNLLTAGKKGESPKLALEDFIADCAAMGLEGTELTSYYFPKQPTPEFLRKLKHTAFRLGLDVSGTAVGNDFCHPPGTARDKELAGVKQWVDHAEILGAPVIRVFSGHPHGQQTFDEAYKLAVAGLEECCDFAGKHGVFLALENHGGLSTKIDDLVRLVRDVKSPWMGINLDTGNFQANASADEAYADMAKMAPYALNVQVKVMIALKGRKAASDFSRLAKILSDSAYRGYIVLEYEEAEDPRKACPRHVDELRKAFLA
jgi:sugar phosphate isomerase/epimerase